MPLSYLRGYASNRMELEARGAVERSAEASSQPRAWPPAGGVADKERRDQVDGLLSLGRRDLVVKMKASVDLAMLVAGCLFAGPRSSRSQLLIGTMAEPAESDFGSLTSRARAPACAPSAPSPRPAAGQRRSLTSGRSGTSSGRARRHRRVSAPTGGRDLLLVDRGSCPWSCCRRVVLDRRAGEELVAAGRRGLGIGLTALRVVPPRAARRAPVVRSCRSASRRGSALTTPRCHAHLPSGVELDRRQLGPPHGLA